VLQRAVQRRRGAEGGFTLIELLIVIVILGILAAIVVFSVAGITDKGEESACNATVKTIEVAQEAYFAGEDLGNGSYADDVQALADAGLLRDSAVEDAADQGVSTDNTGAVTEGTDC
jgi:general secretion pathway protein G